MKRFLALIFLLIITCKNITIENGEKTDENIGGQEIANNNNGLPTPLRRHIPEKPMIDSGYGEDEQLDAPALNLDNGEDDQVLPGVISEPEITIVEAAEPDLVPPPQGNLPPVFVKTPDDIVTVYYDSSYSFVYQVEDPDDDPLTFWISRGKRTQTKISPLGFFVFSPDSSLKNRSIKLDIEVSDGFGSTKHTITFEILDPYQGMISMGSYRIDPYEAVLSFDPYCMPDSYFGQESDDYLLGFPDMIGFEEQRAEEEDTDRLFACSLPGVVPSRFLTWAQAKRGCENVGRRLCTAAELQSGCDGTDPENCNWNDGRPHPTGSKGSCKSTVGAFDLSGNLKEWTMTLVCEPAGDGDPCYDQCLYLYEKAWCDDPANINTLRTEKPLGVGFRQNGGFFKVNKKNYAECGSWEGGLVDEARESVGFRCCK